MQPVYSTFLIEDDAKKQLFEYQAAVGPFQLFLLFCFDNDPEGAAEESFGEVVELLEKHLEKARAGKGYDAFEQALKEVNAVFENPTDVGRHVAREALQLDAIIGVLDGDTLHVTKAGYGESYLMRRGTLVEITEGMEPGDEEEGGMFSSVASGDLAPADKVLFATRRLLRFLKKADLVAMFAPRDVAACLEELETTLAEEKNLSVGVSACVMEESEGEEGAKDTDEEVPVARGDRRRNGKILVLPKQLTKGLGTAGVAVRKGSAFVWAKSKPVAERLYEWFQAQDGKTKLRIVGGVLAVVAVVFLVSVLWTGSARSEQVTLMEQTFQQARSSVADARNKKLFDPAGAKADLEEAKKKLVEVARSGLFVADVQQLLMEIEQEEEGADRITRVTEPKVIADVSKKGPGVSLTAFTFHNQAFYLIAQNAVLGPVVDSNPDTYGTNAVDGGEILLGAANFPDRNAMVLLTKANKLIEFKDNAFSFLETEGGGWKPGIALRTYSTRQFVYVLDPAGNAIWKYERTNKKYRAPTNYNSEKTDLSTAVSFAVDGAVYVLKSDGTILRFYSQKLQTGFTVDGGPSIPLRNLDANAKIYTGENLRNIYVLDPPNERVLVYRKQTFEKTDKIVYERQFTFKGEQLRDLYVDENEQGLYVASAQRVLKADLRVP